MPCYHPLIRYETNQIEKGKNGWHLKATVEKATEESINELKKRPDIIKYQMIPCGKCIGCRLDYSREWANRGYLESKSYENNWFLTLTYDEDHLYIPEEIEDEEGFTYTDDGNWKGCLVPEDLTQFNKNLRQKIQRKYEKDFEEWLLAKREKRKYEPEEPKIRFMACGEYGDEGSRPHYHEILYNLNLPLEDLYDPHIKEGEVYYKSHMIDDCWGKGIAVISECSWNTIAYVARYITKKINGPQSSGMYAQNGQIKEFFRVSRMPGIGQKYFEDHWKEIYARDEIVVKNKNGVVSCQPPAYFDKLLKEKDKYLWMEVKAKRAKKSKDKALIKDDTTSLLRLEQLAIEELTHEEKHQQLIREFEKGL